MIYRQTKNKNKNLFIVYMSFLFTSDGENLKCNNTLIPDTNLLNTDYLQKRFIVDIMKDASVLPNVSNIENLIKNTCKFNGASIPLSKSSYKALLTELNTTIFFRNQNIKKNLRVLNNILKISTNGISSTRISDASVVFWESGFGIKDICTNPKRIITTTASILDTINKQQGNEMFPKNEVIKFDQSFTKRLGFPDNTEWESKPLKNNAFQVTIQYKNGVAINSDVYTKESGINVAERFGKFGDVSKGNEKKNRELNTLDMKLQRNKNDKNAQDTILKIMLTKEFGDVAQVWMYLAFLISSGNMASLRTNSVMITTDSVVLLFCALLHMSCVYTGSREGVQSGNCTLKYYLAGNVDYEVKLQNMLSMLCDNVINHNNSLIEGLEIMSKDVNAFLYYRDTRRTYGGFNTNTQKKKLIVERILIEKEIVEKKNVYMKALKTKFANTVFFQNPNGDNDSQVNKIFSEYSFVVNFLKHFQIITKIKAKQYLLNPADVNAGVLTDSESNFREILFGWIGNRDPMLIQSSGDLLYDIKNIVFNDGKMLGGSPSPTSPPPQLIEWSPTKSSEPISHHKNIKEFVDDILGNGYATPILDKLEQMSYENGGDVDEEEIAVYCRKYDVGYYEFLVLFSIFVTFFHKSSGYHSIREMETAVDNFGGHQNSDLLSMIYDAIVSKAHQSKTIQQAFHDTFFHKTENMNGGIFDIEAIANIVPENVIQKIGYKLAKMVYFESSESAVVGKKVGMRPPTKTQQISRRIRHTIKNKRSKSPKTMRKTLKRLTRALGTTNKTGRTNQIKLANMMGV